MKLILVVDDEDDLRRMTTRLLDGLGYAAVAAANEEEALAALASGRVDAVLLDVVLGDKNGWEALRRIREAGKVPVVMMSGATMDADVLKDALAMGAQDILQKPFETHDLLICLQGILGGPTAPSAR